MKTVLEFGPDEQHEARLAMEAGKWKNVVFEIDQLLRATTKHGQGINGGVATPDQVAYAELLRSEIREAIMSDGLNLND